MRDLLERQEWLVTDHHGLFAMGTAAGVRTRKYHSFLSGIAGRLETNFLADIDLTVYGQGLWTHAYGSEHKLNPKVYHPPGFRFLQRFQSRPWPQWTWVLHEGKLSLQLAALAKGGFELRLMWEGAAVAPVRLKPLWAMRSLHALGGRPVAARREGQVMRFSTPGGATDVRIEGDGEFHWLSDENWYRNFLYELELERGYEGNENLFDAGEFEFTLQHGRPLNFRLRLNDSQDSALRAPLHFNAQALADFVVHEPAGVVAGYPWFGEWGRDTFIALPGIVAGIIREEPQGASEVSRWALAVLERWSQWITNDGMIPNLLTLEGPQWESADATLWWTHSLASLWHMGQSNRALASLAKALETKFREPLGRAVDSIAAGRHRHLVRDASGLLEVTSPHSTWMDAKIEGCAATPRQGILPEINALWIQARALRLAWKDESGRQEAAELTSLAKILFEDNVFSPEELERPNFVFLHSLPLVPASPSAMRRDAVRLVELFLTPVGLRTLSPRAKGYRPRYEGGTVSRDRCYHQGPAWGWLLGHYALAARRFEAAGIRMPRPERNENLWLSSIEGHFAELFDASAPYAPRGAPAQAWSLACRHEAQEFEDARMANK